MENFNQLIPIDEGKGKKRTMTSLQIAEITGKTHSNVMRDIRNILEQLEDRRQFSFELSSRPAFYKNGQNNSPKSEMSEPLMGKTLTL